MPLEYDPCLVSDSSLGKDILVVYPPRVAGLGKPFKGTNNVLKRTVYKSTYGKEKIWKCT